MNYIIVLPPLVWTFCDFNLSYHPEMHLRKMQCQDCNESMDKFKCITRKRRYKRLNMIKWPNSFFIRRTMLSIILFILFNVVISPSKVNCELSEKSRQLQARHKLHSIDDRYIRASTNPNLNKREGTILIPINKSNANFKN